MTTEPPAGEKMAGAMPLPVFVTNDIIVIVSMEFHGKLGEANSLFFLSVAFGLFDFPNQT